MFLEILFPAQQCLVVMVSQVLHIQKPMKVMFRHQGYDFPETGDDPARKYIFALSMDPLCVSFWLLIKWSRNTPPGFSTLSTQSMNQP